MELQNIRNISISGTDCVVDISRGNDNTCKFISAKEKYFDVQANDGALTVEQKPRSILDKLTMRKFEFKLVLPKNFCGRLRFRNLNGGLYIKDVDFLDVDLYTKNGKFDLENIKCAEFGLKMRNGNICIKNLTSQGNVTLKCYNGYIKTESVAAQALTMSCRNAGLTAIDIKSESFECSTDNGFVDASAIDSADVRLETSNGKINALAIGSRNDYRLSLEASHGIITIDKTPSKSVSDPIGAKKRITARTSNGDIDIRFV